MPTIQYRSEIDGLRAIAVLSVMFWHAEFPFFKGGYIGVDVFFVISGFLITSLILRELQLDTFKLKDFYIRRVRRILPALYFVIIACLPIAWLWMLPHQLEEFGQGLVAVSLFSSNILFSLKSGYFANASEENPLLHTWSLAVEEQFYLFFPLMILLFSPLRRSWLIVTVISIAVLSFGACFLWQNGAIYNLLSNADLDWLTINNSLFYSTITRAWELLLGALLAFLLFHKPDNVLFRLDFLGVLGILLIAYAVAVFDEDISYPGLGTLVPCLGTVMIICCVNRNAPSTKLLSNRSLVAIGLMSYSIYLWHQPLFAFARIRSIAEPGLPLMLGLCALTVLLAFVSWKYVEQPFRYGKLSEPSSIYKTALLVSVAVILAGFTLHDNHGFESRLTPVAAKSYHYRNDRNLGAYCMAADEQIKPASACRLGTSSHSEAVFALVGDSHAQAVASQLDKWARKYNLSGRAYTQVGCPPISGIGDIINISCSRHNFSAFENILQDSKLRYVVLNSYWTAYVENQPFDNGEGGIHKTNANMHDMKHRDRSREIINSFTARIQQLLDNDKKVILIYPTPEAGWHVPDYLAKLAFYNAEEKVVSLSTKYSIFGERNAKVYSAFDSLGSNPNLIRVKPEAIFCNTYVKNRCALTIDGVPLYYDSHHLSQFGSALLAEKIIDIIREDNI